MVYHAAGHHIQKFIEVETFLYFLSHLGVDVSYVLLFDFHSEGLHDGLELSGIDFAWVRKVVPVFLLSNILKASLSSLMVY
jgi:hypothetical protein